MPIYLVATRSRYALVEAADETQARDRGCMALHELYADLRKRLGHEVPIDIVTIRRATDEEIQLQGWHDEMVAREEEQNSRA